MELDEPTDRPKEGPDKKDENKEKPSKESRPKRDREPPSVMENFLAGFRNR
ncbi:MAG: hypothetical protein WCO25_03615 [Candidatus Uhrbacteria bacterium]